MRGVLRTFAAAFHLVFAKVCVLPFPANRRLGTFTLLIFLGHLFPTFFCWCLPPVLGLSTSRAARLMYPVDSQYLEYLSLVQPGRLQYSEYIAFSANLDGSGEASCRRRDLHCD